MAATAVSYTEGAERHSCLIGFDGTASPARTGDLLIHNQAL